MVLCGGGDGTFAIAVAERWPELRVTVADLPVLGLLAQQGAQPVVEVVEDQPVDAVHGHGLPPELRGDDGGYF